MLNAILINDEISFTKDDIENTNELVTYDELIDYGCEGNEIPGEMILVKEGVVVFIDDDIDLIEINI